MIFHHCAVQCGALLRGFYADFVKFAEWTIVLKPLMFSIDFKGLYILHNFKISEFPLYPFYEFYASQRGGRCLFMSRVSDEISRPGCVKERGGTGC